MADYYESPVARKYADVFYQVSTLDVDAIRNIAAREKVGLIITVCTDQALLTMAQVSENLGLPCYLDYATALNVTNKQYMKKVFSENGIPTAEYVSADNIHEILRAGLQFPLVVKPADCNSSKGVVKVNDMAGLEEAFNAAKSLSRSHSVVVERCIDGAEISVDAWIENGKAKILCMSRNDKIPGTFVIFRGIYPSREALAMKDKIQDAAQKIADAFRLKNCPLLMQCITDGHEVNVLEFSARTGGGTKHIMINHVAGLDVVDMTVELALGNIPHVDDVSMADIYLADEFIYCSAGVFDRLEGFDALKENGILSDYYLFKWQGAEFDGSIKNSGDRIAGYTVIADSLESLRDKRDKALREVRVIDISGRDIMRHDLFTAF
ncbi:MAG: ATP-grasp domain-containing protein [Synergistaceae bacterium]|nr:ATP-grasp domain-containing protein [Synergistaceae bacterium]